MSTDLENETARTADALPQVSIAIVIPVHNRREITLRCLAELARLGVSHWADIIVVDDGSTDGTNTAISERYPQVTVSPGSGHLWWTGAIVQGMRHALSHGAELIFWLNDDCVPQPGTLELLASHAATQQAVAVAQAFTPSGGRYGAFLKTTGGLRAIEASRGEILGCDTFCGNCVCFPRALIEKVGLPDARHFPQSYGDSDYGLRLSRLRLPINVLGDAVCKNDDNHNVISKSWLLSPEPLSKIFASFFHPRSGLYPFSYFHHTWRHWGLYGIVLFVAAYGRFFCYAAIRTLVPRRWLVSWFGGRSFAWRRESTHKI